MSNVRINAYFAALVCMVVTEVPLIKGSLRALKRKQSNAPCML
jgi:hypothetical protein